MGANPGTQAFRLHAGETPALPGASRLARRCSATMTSSEKRYDSSNPWLWNFSVRLFSLTVRTTFSGTPSGTFAAMSKLTVTSAPTRPDK